jgi:hypothetical protein
MQGLMTAIGIQCKAAKIKLTVIGMANIDNRSLQVNFIGILLDTTMDRTNPMRDPIVYDIAAPVAP